MSEVALTTVGSFEVAGFRVEPSTLRVRRDGRDARLEAKAMQVLIYLAEHAGRVVSRPELEEQLWPGRFVTADSVTGAIAKLRRVFGDDAREPRVIETVPKSGYRLIAEVVPIPSTDLNGRSSHDSDGAPAHLGQGWETAWIATILVMLALGIALWTLLETDETEPGPSSPLTDKPAVAVLPFENLGATPDQDYFANGITADLITDLSRLEALRVIAPGSVFAYEGGKAGMRRISRDMDLDYVVVGKVQRLGDRFRINVQLIESDDERALWGKRYTGTMNDVFDVQDRITSAVIAALEVKLSTSEQALLADRPTANALAYDRYLRGLEEHGGRSPIQNLAARDHFRDAIELDPGFARAYAGLAMTYSREAIDGWTERPLQALGLAAELVETATDLEPSLPQVHFVTGQIDLFRRRYADAVAAAQRAIDVEPNYADAYALKAWTLNYAGRPEEAFDALERATRLSPRPPASYLEILGEIQFAQRKYPESASTFQRVLQINPGYARARMWNAAALARAGLIDGAEWEIDELLISNPKLRLERLEFAFPFSESDTLDRLRQALRMAGLPD
ncbi:MAG: winged helix-turn-helix domain-containing protein [Thiohalocapsa sp.]